MNYKLQIQDVHHIFNQGQPNEVYALKGVNLNFNAGELVLIVGHNGSGKSTLLNIIDGRIRQTKGHVIIDNYIVDDLKVYQRAKYIYRIFQDTLNGLIRIASIKENMAFAKKRNSKFRITQPLIKKTDLDYFKNILIAFNKTLANDLDKKIFNLSPGERQAVILALLEMQKDLQPQILLADEPTASLDPEMSLKSFNTIKSLSEKGWLCLVVTHDEALIRSEQYDRMIKFEKGTVVADVKLKD